MLEVGYKNMNNKESEYIQPYTVVLMIISALQQTCIHLMTVCLKSLCVYYFTICVISANWYLSLSIIVDFCHQYTYGLYESQLVSGSHRYNSIFTKNY